MYKYWRKWYVVFILRLDRDMHREVGHRYEVLYLLAPASPSSLTLIPLHLHLHLHLYIHTNTHPSPSSPPGSSCTHQAHRAHPRNRYHPRPTPQRRLHHPRKLSLSPRTGIRQAISSRPRSRPSTSLSIRRYRIR